MISTVAGSPLVEALDDDRPCTILLSDLHVTPDGGQVLEDLGHLLGRAAKDAARTRVLILGDLFHWYVGSGQLVLGAWREMTELLQKTVAAGVSMTVLCGNRDFLLDVGFQDQTGCRLVMGGLRLSLDGRPTLALHGEELCLRDHPYQRSKCWLRHPVTRGLMHRMPLKLARALAQGVRSQSQKVVNRGDQNRFRPPAWALRAAFGSGVEVLVFGHIHCRTRGRLNGAGEYWVLPAFDEGGIHLRCGPGVLAYCDRQGQPLPDPPETSFT